MQKLKTAVQSDVSASGIVDMFMRKFSEVSKHYVINSERISLFESDRSQGQGDTTLSRKRGLDISTCRLPPSCEKTKDKKTVIDRSFHELSDVESDEETSEKSDAEDAFKSLTLIKGGDCCSSDDDEASALHELSEFFGDEKNPKTTEPLSPDLDKRKWKKKCSTKTNSE